MDLRKVRKLVMEGKIRILSHAAQRMIERGYTLPEVEQVLRGGFHEKERDEYNSQYNSWTYAIRGRTGDKRDTRVVIALIRDVIVVTIVGPL